MRLCPRSSSAVVRSGDTNQGGHVAVLVCERDELDAAFASFEGTTAPSAGIRARRAPIGPHVPS
jgi:hypothetical protein